MDGVDSRARFQLDEHALRNDEVDTLARYGDPSIMNGDGSFAFEWKPACMKFQA